MPRRTSKLLWRAIRLEPLEERCLLAPLGGSATATDLGPPLMFDWLVRSYNASSPPPDGFACVPHPNHDGSNPLATSIVNTYLHNASHGLPVSLMLRSDTAPLTGATESKRATLATTMDWLSANGLPLDYVFSDFETATREEDLLEVVRQVRSYPDPQISSARINDYPNYPGAIDMSQIWQSSVDRSAADAFYRTSGQDAAMPNAYPYEYMEVHTRTSQWGTNVAPNKRSALFWAPLERVSVAKRALPEGHQLIPWMTRFVAWENYDAPEPTREDNVALLRHVRLRGADGFYSLNSLVDKAYGFQDPEWLFDAPGVEILNLETDKTGGLQWSGARAGHNVSLAISNLGNGPSAVDLPEIAGLPDASPVLPAGIHYAADYVNDPAAIDAGATLTIGRDAIPHGLFVNGSGTLANPLAVDAAGTGAVTIGSDLAGDHSPVFAGLLALNRDVTLLGASAASATFGGLMTGPGGIVVDGPGSIVLDNVANDFTGPTTVASGVLLVNGRTGSGPVTVDPQAALGGRGGLIGGSLHVLAGAAIAPGPGPARLVAEQGAVIDPGATVRIELDGTSPGASHDQLEVVGALSLAGSVLDLSLGYAPRPGDRFTIIDNDSTDPVVGTFAGLDEGAYLEVAGHGFTISYSDGDGNDVVLSAIAGPDLDADGNGTADPLSDGILVLRYLFDPGGQWSVDDALGQGFARSTRAAIKGYLDAGKSTVLDADGNGAADPLSDGILILRYLLDPEGSWNLADALGAAATRTTWDDVKLHLGQYLPAGQAATMTLKAAPLLSQVETIALAYIEDETAKTITAAIAVGDADSPQLAGATIQITDNYQDGQDELSFEDTPSITGTWTAATGTLTLSGSDTPENYQAALRAVKYRNTSQCPSTATRTVAFTVNDGSSDSNPLARNVTVTAVNDAPAGADATCMIGQDVSHTFAAADFSFSDPLDSSANALKAVKIATLPEAGSLTCDGVAVSAGQHVSAAEIDAGKLVFTPAPGAHAEPYASFTFQVQDDGGAASLAPFTVTVLPDTQNHAAQPAWFNTQIQWICDNIAGQNTVFVAHVGDITNTNSATEWANAREAMYRLDGQVPWGVIPGNHDGSAGFLESFGPAHFAGRSWYGGAYSTSSCQSFQAGGRTYLSLEIAYGAGADVFAWAQAVLDNNPGVPTIVTTHDYMNSAGTRSAAGNTLWDSLIKLNPQVFMVLCGHYGNKGNLAHNVAYDDAGKPVFQIISNYQETPPYDAVWLRLMQFDEPNGEIRVNTYSPYYLGDWETIVGGPYVANNRFELAVNFVERFGPAGQQSGVDLDPTANTMTFNVVGSSLDADGNGAAEPLSDGILILRYLFDPGGRWSVSDALGEGAARTTREDIKAFLDAGRTTVLDTDGNGTADALADGILILRYLLDPAGSWNIDDALDSGATRTTWVAITDMLDAFNPSAAAPAQ